MQLMPAIELISLLLSATTRPCTIASTGSAFPRRATDSTPKLIVKTAGISRGLSDPVEELISTLPAVCSVVAESLPLSVGCLMLAAAELRCTTAEGLLALVSFKLALVSFLICDALQNERCDMPGSQCPSCYSLGND